MIRLHSPDFKTIPVLQCSPASWAAELALAYTGMHYDKIVHTEKLVTRLTEQEPDFHAPATLPALEYRPADKHGNLLVEKNPIVIYHPLGILQFIQDLPSAGLQVAPAAAFRREIAYQFEAYNFLKTASKLFTRCQQSSFLNSSDDKLIRELEAHFQHWDNLATNWTYENLCCSQILIFVVATTTRYLGYNFPNKYFAMGNWCAQVAKIIAVRHSWPSTWPEYENFDTLNSQILRFPEMASA